MITPRNTMQLYVLALILHTGLSAAGTRHGAVESKEINTIQGGVVEQVKIFPRKESGSQERLERRGVLFRYPKAEATILICHGFMCDKFDVAFLRSLFSQGRFNVMTFDFRAHGENTGGQYCTFGKNESLDVIAAAKFLKSHKDLQNKPLFVYGFSMGAVSAIMAQSQKKNLFDAMILDCPFDHSENIIKKGLESMKLSFLGYEFDIPGRDTLQRYAFHPYVQAFVKAVLRTVAHMDSRNIQVDIAPVNSAAAAADIEVPCLFIHCKNDEKVPVSAVESIFAKTKGYKELWVTDGRRHFDSFFFNPEQYADKIKTFLARAIKKDFPKTPPVHTTPDSSKITLVDAAAVGRGV